VNCHREAFPVLRKSLVGCPDQRECRWLVIRCRGGQESYVLKGIIPQTCVEPPAGDHRSPTERGTISSRQTLIQSAFTTAAGLAGASGLFGMDRPHASDRPTRPSPTVGASSMPVTHRQAGSNGWNRWIGLPERSTGQISHRKRSLEDAARSIGKVPFGLHETSCRHRASQALRFPFSSWRSKLCKGPRLKSLNSVLSPANQHPGSGRRGDLLRWGRSVWR